MIDETAPDEAWLLPAELLCTALDEPKASRTVAKRLLWPEMASSTPLPLIDLRSTSHRIVYTQYVSDLSPMPKRDEKLFFLSGVVKSLQNAYDRAILQENFDRQKWYCLLRDIILRNGHRLWFCLSLLSYEKGPFLPPAPDKETEMNDSLAITRQLLATAPHIIAIDASGRIAEDTIHRSLATAEDSHPMWRMMWGNRLRSFASPANRITKERSNQFMNQNDPKEAIQLMKEWIEG